MRALQSGRVVVAAKALGIALGCFDDAVRYANERVVRGKPIGQFQMIQSDIAEMATAIEASRALVYETARHMDAGLPTNRLSQLPSSTLHKPPNSVLTRRSRYLAATGSPRNTAFRAINASPI